MIKYFCRDLHVYTNGLVRSALDFSPGAQKDCYGISTYFSVGQLTCMYCYYLKYSEFI